MPKQNLTILLVGSGGREHALYESIRHSPKVERVLCAPGNGGIPARDRRAVSAEDIAGLLALAKDERADLTVVGPEVPLVEGIADVFRESGLWLFGPSKAAARLEGSKIFAKESCVSCGVRTARYEVAHSLRAAERIIKRWPGIPVIKADGLCAGKGVVVAESKEEAAEAARDALEKDKFGEAGSRVLIEERLEGKECSLLAICDGENAVLLPSARDHKALYAGKGAPMTSGIGAFSPIPGLSQAFMDEMRQLVFLPVLRGMAARGTPYHGVLYAGLMLTREGPSILEFNCRFGDPETQVILPRLSTDIVDLMLRSLERGGLAGLAPLAVREGAAVCVTLISGGYPGAYGTGFPIRGADSLMPHASAFHAGTSRTEDGALVTSGGRVLHIVGEGPTIAAARTRAYEAAAQIEFEGKTLRFDIAQDV